MVASFWNYYCSSNRFCRTFKSPWVEQTKGILEWLAKMNIYVWKIFIWNIYSTYVNKQWCAETNHQQATISCCSFFLPTSLVAAPFVNTSVTFLYPDKQSTFYSAARLVVDLLAVPFYLSPVSFWLLPCGSSDSGHDSVTQSSDVPSLVLSCLSFPASTPQEQHTLYWLAFNFWVFPYLCPSSCLSSSILSLWLHSPAVIPTATLTVCAPIITE